MAKKKRVEFTPRHTKNHKEALEEKRKASIKRRKRTKFALAITVPLGLVLLAFVVVKETQPKTATEATKGSVTPAYITSDGSYRITAAGGVDTTANDDYNAEKVRVEVFFDPTCPSCTQFDRAASEGLLKLVEEEKIDLYMMPVSFLDDKTTDKYSTRAVNAIATVATESPEHVYETISALFIQRDNSPESQVVSVTDEEISQQLQAIGVPKAKAELIKDRTYEEWILKQTAFSISRKDLFQGDFSTPAIFLGGTIDSDGRVSGAKRLILRADEPPMDTLTRVYELVATEQSSGS